jgi:hypothetical protein
LVPRRNIILAAKVEKAAGEEDADPVVIVAPVVREVTVMAVKVVGPAVGEAIAAAVEALVDRVVTAGPVAIVAPAVTAAMAEAAAEGSRQSQNGPLST